MNDKYQLALIDLQGGEVKQFIPLGISGGAAGFTAEGDQIWTQITNVISIYQRH